ncbi:hypothetical protein Lalb_Chr01g0023411 [Lupinus albus]|uniref:Defensin-like protein n=1 Tax=Lupinus albus TaxID=3870 RepID=A0A6A4R5Z1_LUPAL|nr:hypothetical protein Lalb_Chr01g0023411 [Lupinus albus]
MAFPIYQQLFIGMFCIVALVSYAAAGTTVMSKDDDVPNCLSFCEHENKECDETCKGWGFNRPHAGICDEKEHCCSCLPSCYSSCNHDKDCQSTCKKEGYQNGGICDLKQNCCTCD